MRTVSESGPAAGRAGLAGRIQHTLIAPGVDLAQMRVHVQECLRYGFDAAMVGACWVGEVRAMLEGSLVKIASAVDFPYGSMTTAGRVAETRSLVQAGVDQIDVGVYVGWLRSGRADVFSSDLRDVVSAAEGVPVKVMLELPLLSADERLAAVEAAVAAGASYVKNASSGAVGVADPADIAWLRAHVPATVGVKASGGIRSRAQVDALIAAGADLVGTSSGVAIIDRDGASEEASVASGMPSGAAATGPGATY